jgi:TldD protein
VNARRTAIALTFATLGAGALLVGDVHRAAAKPPNGPTSTAVTEVVLDAIAREMNRDMTSLAAPGMPLPYHISYKVTEVEVNDVVASLGETTTKKTRHFVNLEARVRIGIGANPADLDNANYIVPGGDGIDGVAGRSLPIEATARIAERAAWQVTDEAYKEALYQLQAKLDARQSTGIKSELPSWTMEKAIVSEEPVLVPELESLESIEDRAKKISAGFRNQPDLRDSRVAITSYLERRWYLNSEGTSITDTRRASGIIVAATAQADDGQELAQYFARYGQTAGDLPTDAELEGEVKRLTSTLVALRTAPRAEPYSGPVLFEGEGAVGMVRYSLAPHLGGTPLPEGLNPQQAKQFGGALTDRLGLRVASNNVSIVDDPTTSTAAGKALIGGYKIDDEGVAAQKVQVVQKGMLKSLLTSRTPSSKGAMSNGHARRTTEGGMFHGSATNLIVSATGGTTRSALVAKLLSAAKSEGLKYGIIIRQFDDSAITAAPEFSRRELYAMLQSADVDLPPPASLVYKVYPNGKEELLRGAQLTEIPIRVWKDIIGVGKTPLVYNYLAAPESYLANKFGGGTDDGAVPSSGIESAVVTPDLLFKEIDLKPITSGRRAAPAVPSPVAKK